MNNFVQVKPQAMPPTFLTMLELLRQHTATASDGLSSANIKKK